MKKLKLIVLIMLTTHFVLCQSRWGISDINGVQFSLHSSKNSANGLAILNCSIANSGNDTIYLNGQPGAPPIILYDVKSSKVSNEVYVGFYQAYSQGIVVTARYELFRLMPGESMSVAILLEDRVKRKKVSIKKMRASNFFIQFSYILRRSVANIVCDNQLLCHSIDGSSIIGVLQTTTLTINPE